MNNKIKRLIRCGMILLFLVLLGGCKDADGQNSDVDKDNIILDNNLIITAVSSYSGVYVEDGTDESVKDILMISVRNDGNEVLQYAEVCFIYGEEIANFSFSTLQPGKTVKVLEKNRLKFNKEKILKEGKLTQVVFFQEPLSYQENLFRITAMDGVFNIENISGKDLTGWIAVYYKTKEEDEYLGGITYRAVIEGGIEKDGMKQIMTSHFSLDKSEVMFVTYQEAE